MELTRLLGELWAGTLSGVGGVGGAPPVRGPRLVELLLGPTRREVL